MLRLETTVLKNVAVIIWGAAILLSVFVASVALLATVAPESNWAEITLAVATCVLALATVALAVGALFALLALGETRRTRHAEAIAKAGRRWNEPEFRKIRAKVRGHIANGGAEGFSGEMLKLRDNESREYKNDAEYYELLTIPNYFEEVAVLVKYHAVTFRMVDDSLGKVAISTWDDWWPFVRELRKEPKHSRSYEKFQNLVEEINRNRAAREGS